MNAALGFEIDPFGGDADEVQRAFAQRFAFPDQREHGAVVVGVLMNVDETDGRGQADGVPERFDRFGITPIGEIGNGFDQGWLAVFLHTCNFNTIGFGIAWGWKIGQIIRSIVFSYRVEYNPLKK